MGGFLSRKRPCRDTKAAAMRHLRWIPLTFLCDVHGFAIFVPYAAAVLAVLPWLMRRSKTPAK